MMLGRHRVKLDGLTLDEGASVTPFARRSRSPAAL